jgi:hypothetical protein
VLLKASSGPSVTSSLQLEIENEALSRHLQSTCALTRLLPDRGFRSQNIHSRHFIDKILKTRGLPVDGSHRRRGMTSPGSCSKDVKDRFGAPPPERRKLMQELLAVTSILAGGVKL